MIFATIFPIVSTIVMSFTCFADAGPTVLPCAETTGDATFKVTDFTGGIGRYTGGESFVFYLSTTFNDYSSGCSGSLDKGAADNGLQWCLTRVPGWNASFVMTSDHKVSVGHDFLCSQGDGTVITAHAEGATALNVKTSANGGLAMSPATVTFPASVQLP